MGCASSKEKRCKQCREPYSPVPRSYSMHVVHPPQKKGDSYHLVALTSTTLGSLALDSSSQNHPNGAASVATKVDMDQNGDGRENGVVNNHTDELKSKGDGFAMGLIEAKAWSNMITEKIPKVVPKTPILTPPGEPETINTWELMAGLEDTSPVHLTSHRFRSFSFDVSRDSGLVPDSPKLNFQQKNGTLSPVKDRPIWGQLADDDDKCPEFDPEVISTFRKSFQEFSVNHASYLKPTDCEKQAPLSATNGLSVDGIDAKKLTNGVARDYKCGGTDKVVVYFTSLRGVRKTYEDSCHVRVILKGLGVRVDERDLSMHSGFKDELRELLGEGFRGGGLPRVFVGKKYIGGAEEIRRMHEEGQLEKVVEGCEMVVDDGGRGGGGACEACGDIRFVPCETCSGSCKIYHEGGEEENLESEESDESGDYGFQRCPDCNENGLIRCPICCE